MGKKLLVNKTNSRKVLKYLKEQIGPVSQQPLEHILHTNKSLITHALKELKESEYVKIEKLGRENKIQITERGRKAIEDLKSEPIGDEFKYYLEKVKIDDTRQTAIRVLTKVAVDKYPQTKAPINEVLKLLAAENIKSNENDFADLLFILMHLCNKSVQKGILNKEDRNEIAEKMVGLIGASKSLRVMEKSFDVWRVLKTEVGLNEIFSTIKNIIESQDSKVWEDNQPFVEFCLSFIPHKKAMEDRFWDYLKSAKDDAIKKRYERLIFKLSEDRMKLSP